MIAILTESYAGKWPFWLSPRQVMIVPVGQNYDDYARQVRDQLHEAGFMVEVDTDAGDTLNKKIRNAQLAQFNFILGKLKDDLLNLYCIHFLGSCGRKREIQRNG